jgi:hypothetical protein
LGHDAINRGILVETRDKREGVYGLCERCDGKGHYYHEDSKAQLALVLWVLHPRKGASRGVEVKSITKEQVPEVLEYLREANERNVQRFQKAVEFASAFEDAEEAFASLSALPHVTDD